MFKLIHKHENKVISCYSYEQALSEYYRQWREPDGSIPWTISQFGFDYNPDRTKMIWWNRSKG